MITLVNQFAANIEEKKGSVTEDEVRYTTSILLMIATSYQHRLLHSSPLYLVLVLLIQSQGQWDHVINVMMSS